MITKNLYLFDRNEACRFQISSNQDAPFINIFIEKINERAGCFIVKEAVQLSRGDLKELKSFIDQLIKDFENED
jgi:hypothetical protein